MTARPSLTFAQKIRDGKSAFMRRARRAQMRALLAAVARIEGRGMETNAGAVYAEYLKLQLTEGRLHVSDRHARSMLATLAAEGYVVRNTINRGRYGVTSIYRTPPNTASIPLSFPEDA